MADYIPVRSENYGTCRGGDLSCPLMKVVVQPKNWLSDAALAEVDMEVLASSLPVPSRTTLTRM